MSYLLIKALHIIFMVSYFAGIFYLVRLFVYYKDTDEMEPVKQKILREQYAYMTRRLWNIITAPAGFLMVTFGVTLIFLNPGLLTTPWFRLKICGLVGLLFYHIWCWKKVVSIQHLLGESLKTSNLKLRQYNEIATFILFFVVLVVSLKQYVITHWWQLLLGFFALVFTIGKTVKLVNKNKRKKK